MDRVHRRKDAMMEKPVFDRIIDDFVGRIRESQKLRENAIRELEQLLRRRELRPEHIRKVVFAPEDVE